MNTYSLIGATEKGSATTWFNVIILVPICLMLIYFANWALKNPTLNAHVDTLIATGNVTKSSSFDNSQYPESHWYVVLNTGRVGSTWTFESGKIYNSFGGRVTIDAIEGRPHDFQVVSRDIPDDYCTRLAEAAFPVVQSMGIGDSADNVKGAGRMALDPVAINNACDTDEPQTFTFRVGASV